MIEIKACGATLSIADDYGDNEGTIKCQLPPGHEGRHTENFQRNHVTWKDEVCREQAQQVTITWTVDETCYLEDFEEYIPDPDDPPDEHWAEKWKGTCRHCVMKQEEHVPRG